MRRALALAALLTASAAVPAWCAPDSASPISLDAAMAQLYNFDFDGAHRVLDQWIADHPADPLGHALQAAAYMFAEFARLHILDAEFFQSDKRIADRHRLSYDPAVRARFYSELAQAKRLADRQLVKDPRDQDALFVEAISGGLLTDYASLVEKRGIASLSYAQESQAYAARLLRLNPGYTDAYLTSGFSDYLLGSLPFFVRWFVHFDDAQGDKREAIRRLQKVAAGGHYLKPFSKILLAIIYLRERQPAQAERLLAGLSSEYPRNPLLRGELTKVEALVQSGKTRE